MIGFNLIGFILLNAQRPCATGGSGEHDRGRYEVPSPEVKVKRILAMLIAVFSFAAIAANAADSKYDQRLDFGLNVRRQACRDRARPA